MRITLLKLLDALTREVELPEPIYEFGSFRVPGQRHLREVSSYFPGKRYVGCDLSPGPGVDEIQDLHQLTLADATVGTALLFDTIEHVRNPWQALAEVRRTLRPGGVLVMSSVWYFPIHAYPDDYWRFTASAFRELLQGYHLVTADMFGLARLPHTVIAVATQGEPPAAVGETLRRVVADWGRDDASSWKELAMEIVPPRLLIPAYDAYLRLQDRFHRRAGSEPSATSSPRSAPELE
jgi:SAM-dependent methyltransferase